MLIRAGQPSNQLLSFSDGFVLVDVRASASGDTLLTDLVQLGLTRGARAGEIVSGLLPIAALGDAVALSSLRSIVAL